MAEAPRMPRRRSAGLAAVMLASTFLLTVGGASPAAAATGRAYVADHGSDTVSVVDLATNTLVTTIPVGDGPIDVAVVQSPTTWPSPPTGPGPTW